MVKGQEKKENHSKESGFIDHKGREIGTAPEINALGTVMLFRSVKIRC